MKWYKEVIVDVLVTVIIVSAVATKMDWLRYLLLGYTVLLILLRSISLWGSVPLLTVKRKNTAVPNWFFHLLYALNVLLLLIFKYWSIAAGWGLIWLLSWLSLSQKAKTALKLKKR